MKITKRLYTVKWESIKISENESETPILRIIEDTEDVDFKDFYIRVTDNLNRTYIIPYNRIFDIEVKSIEVEEGIYMAH